MISMTVKTNTWISENPLNIVFLFLVEEDNFSSLSKSLSSFFPVLYTALTHSKWFKKEKLYYDSNFAP